MQLANATVNNIILQHHEQLKANQINNAAAMVVDVETGNILSYVGNIYEPDDSSLESHVMCLPANAVPAVL